MLTVSENLSLTQYNTFGIDVYARLFIEFDNESDIIDYLNNNKEVKDFLILGGGSNILFTENYSGIIFHSKLTGIEVIAQTDSEILIEVASGVCWDDFVSWAVENNYYGIENLSLIPGNVGAVPVQNIGAYGVEIKDFIYSINAIDLLTGKQLVISPTDCEFGYRQSIFKTRMNQVLITRVTIRLSKKPDFVLSYGNIQDELKKFDEVNLKTVRQSIINIRTSKLPDPKILGNAGSFFKNPVVSSKIANKLLIDYPGIPLYETTGGYKIAAGWLIEKCGWKGKKYKNAAVHNKQALVIINLGNAKGSDILELSELIIESVYKVFKVRLECEVIIK